MNKEHYPAQKPPRFPEQGLYRKPVTPPAEKKIEKNAPFRRAYPMAPALKNAGYLVKPTCK